MKLVRCTPVIVLQSRITGEVVNCPNLHPDILSCPEITEVDIDIEMQSTVFERPGVYNNVMKNHLHELSGSIRVVAKTVLGVILPPPPRCRYKG